MHVNDTRYVQEQQSLGGRRQGEGKRFNTRFRDKAIVDMAAEGWSHIELGNLFNLCRQTVWRIVTGKQRRCLTLEETQAIPWNAKAVLRRLPITTRKVLRAIPKRLSVWAQEALETAKEWWTACRFCHDKGGLGDDGAAMCPYCGMDGQALPDWVLAREIQDNPHLAMDYKVGTGCHHE